MPGTWPWDDPGRGILLPGVVLTPKAQVLCTGARTNLRDRVLGEVEEDNFIALPGKGGYSRLLPQKTMCPKPGGFDEKFYSNSSGGRLLTRLGCVKGLHSLHLISGARSPNLEHFWSL